MFAQDKKQLETRVIINHRPNLASQDTLTKGFHENEQKKKKIIEFFFSKWPTRKN
jgi:hypothetical protein